MYCCGNLCSRERSDTKLLRGPPCERGDFGGGGRFLALDASRPADQRVSQTEYVEGVRQAQAGKLLFLWKWTM